MEFQKSKSCAITHETVLKCFYNFYKFFTKLNCGSFCLFKDFERENFCFTKQN